MRPLIAILVLSLAASTAASTSWGQPWQHHGNYVGPGTIVASFTAGPPGTDAQATFVDNGALVCEDTDGDGSYDKGQGGMCIHFWELYGEDSILVEDALAFRDVAFQVCVDANGDGICSAGILGDPFFTPCADAIVFSHNSVDGGFDNPMLLPPELQQAYWDCGGAGFPGYIVILCSGAHQTFGSPTGHTHEVTFGQVYSTYGGTPPRGDYCGSPTDTKAYVLR